MYTEYSKALNFFRAQSTHSPNTDLKNILCNFLTIKQLPDDVGAALYLISSYHSYNALLAKANSHVNY